MICGGGCNSRIGILLSVWKQSFKKLHFGIAKRYSKKNPKEYFTSAIQEVVSCLHQEVVSCLRSSNGREKILTKILLIPYRIAAHLGKLFWASLHGPASIVHCCFIYLYDLSHIS